MFKHVLIIPDGAADTSHKNGGSPLRVANTPSMDFLAREGFCGLMRTLYDDLPRESMVAHLGMLGWDPHLYYPHGRASSELLASHGIRLNHDDIAFRANFVRMNGDVLASYNAGFLQSAEAEDLALVLHSKLGRSFPEIELYHQSDFRNALLFREARIDPRELGCPEPHECQGCHFDVAQLVTGQSTRSKSVARRINAYLAEAKALLEGRTANALFPWSASSAFELPSFQQTTKLTGRVAIVGYMDFLCGIAKAGDIEFHSLGNGRPDTDYRAKGRKIIELLEADYSCVICHINGPDEASHMGDIDTKIRSLEDIDEHIVAAVVRYFCKRPQDLGAVMVVPDHYSNTVQPTEHLKRRDIHSLDPVPFACWKNGEEDCCEMFSESEAARGKYGIPAVSHLDLLPLLFTSTGTKPRLRAVGT